MDTRPEKEDLIDGLKSFSEDVDGVPTVRGMRSEGPYSPHYYKEVFGSWHDALRAADIQPTHGVRPDVDRDELLADLERIDDVTDRPPRRTDVDEIGEYSYELYDEEFESFVLALEAAGIDPDEKQYRFSSVETPETKKGSANIEKLRNDGPTPVSELTQGRSTKDREHGMWKFTMSSGGTRPAAAIYYLHEEHAPELVLRRFFDQNPHVLEFREPHGIKMDIAKHQTSWKGIGQDVVDELVDSGLAPSAECDTVAVVRLGQRDQLRYCFESSVAESAGGDEVPIDGYEDDDRGPIWGFSRDNEQLWQTLSEQDALLFSEKPGVLTHYVPVDRTVENSDVMSELWVEYDDGIRSGGIEEPWPYVVLGKDLREISISEEQFAEDLDLELGSDSIRLIDESELETFTNRYGGFEPYLRERDRTEDDSPDPDTLADRSRQAVVDRLRQLTAEDLGATDESRFGDVDQETVRAAFEEAILDLYPGCAVCGDRLESPSGRTNLKATLVLPRDDGGPDLLQNGLVLCGRHHWAFEHGWFEIDEDYSIRVRNYPDLDGYTEFLQYHGESLLVPDETRFQPDPRFVRQRNRLHDR